MRPLLIKTTALFFVSIMASACFHTGSTDEETMLGLASALTKVSAATNSAVRYKHPPADLKDRALLDFATAHNPSLLNKFEGYVLKARQSGKSSSVLVCDEQGKTALIEDTGCTAKLDVHLWQSDPLKACEYDLDIKAVCKAP
ncbi:MAG: hypothetical protein COB46_13185 [Rhodospirillaceae bacterium]|nr:MAG: hypothetical protein COB46_13185 [Rhodospirillaceae bacterium]